jgi:hypothetical protein
MDVRNLGDSRYSGYNVLKQGESTPGEARESRKDEFTPETREALSLRQLLEKMARAAKQAMGKKGGAPPAPSSGGTAGAPSAPSAGAEVNPQITECVRAMGRAVMKDGSSAPLSGDEIATVSKTLKLYAPEALKKLKGKGVLIYIVDSHVTPGGAGYPGMKPGEAWPAGVGAFYHPAYKFMVVPRDYMGHTGVVTHELGHAIDDAMKSDQGSHIWLSEDDRECKKIFDDYLVRVKTDPGMQWNGPNTAPNVVEYFAEGLRVYHSSMEERAKLRRLDPDLSRYVEKSMDQFIKSA